MIELRDVSVRYPAVLAIDNLSFKFEKNLIYGLVGPNGAGKTSLIQSIVGLITEYSGDILFDEIPIRKNSFSAKSKIGFAPEDVSLFPFLSANEYLHFLADVRLIKNAAEKISYLINQFGLEEVADEVIDRYSHGMCKKLSLAGAMIADPQYIILDEALNGLDPMAMHNVRNLLQEKAKTGKTILLSSHVLELVENWCDVIVILNRGKIIGSFSQDEITNWREKSGKTFSDYFVELINDQRD